MMSSNKDFLKGTVVFILEQGGISKTRKGILVKQVETHGGGVASNPAQRDITHILIGNTVKRWSRLLQLLKLVSIPESVDVVCVDWLSACLVAGHRLDPSPYHLIRSQPSATSGSNASTGIAVVGKRDKGAKEEQLLSKRTRRGSLNGDEELVVDEQPHESAAEVYIYYKHHPPTPHHTHTTPTLYILMR